ncbi:MAG TPA: hypothetical protein VGJ84_06185, partial [Polyangiaceae bacterium]
IRDVYVPAAVYRVWYRVFAEQLDPSGEVNAFTIETALPGAEPGTLSIGMPPLADLGVSTTPLRYGSEVLTADVPLPAGLKLPGFIGYAIFVGDRRPCGQLSPPPVRVAVIIDHIGAPQ